ncbi:MAG: helix-turn-helix transcriptional regulator [Kofleriaceae bacterium]|nr:helix-turn-helix transcriptional regulator [Kofleriaceae bacterium]
MLAIPKDLVSNSGHLVRELEGGHLIRYRSNTNTQATQFLVTDPTLVYVASGTKKLRPHGSDELIAPAGSLVTLRPGAHVMSELVADETPYTSIILSFDRAWVSSTVGEKGSLLSQQRATVTRPSPAFVEAIHSVPSADAICRDWVDNLLRTTEREGVLELLWTEAEHSRQEPESRMRTVMSEHCLSPLMVPEYAVLCAMSLSSYKRIFRRSFGIAPGRWLLGVRLHHAKTLLLEDELSVTDICYQSGFLDLSNFSRVFRQHFGIPPSQIRTLSP